jgi:hypothetical protein
MMIGQVNEGECGGLRKADRVEDNVEMHGSDWGTGKKSESFSTFEGNEN